MADEIIKTMRSPKDFMDCLMNLRVDGCIGCDYRPKRLGNWESCSKRAALKEAM